MLSILQSWHVFQSQRRSWISSPPCQSLLHQPSLQHCQHETIRTVSFLYFNSSWPVSFRFSFTCNNFCTFFVEKWSILYVLVWIYFVWSRKNSKERLVWLRHELKSMQISIKAPISHFHFVSSIVMMPSRQYFIEIWDYFCFHDIEKKDWRLYLLLTLIGPRILSLIGCNDQWNCRQLLNGCACVLNFMSWTVSYV